MKKIILIALLLLSSQAQAEEISDALKTAMKTFYLKVDNPDELAISAAAESDCPITGDELKEMVSGVLIRARVKPLLGDELSENSLYMETTLRCLETDGNPIFAIEVIFGGFTEGVPVWYPIPYRYMGMGREEWIVSNIKNVVELAITDYIAANLDL